MPVAVVVALVVQTAVLARVQVAGVVPDAMALLAVSAAVVGGPAAGAATGFAAGLGMDLFLPSTPLGLSALVFSIVGYATGVVAEGYVRTTWWIPVVTVAAASAGAEAAFALTAAVVGTPGVLNAHLATVAGVVALTNGVLAPAGLRLAAWGLRRPAGVAAR
jgi:rod shape-determining protein MreD